MNKRIAPWIFPLFSYIQLCQVEHLISNGKLSGSVLLGEGLHEYPLVFCAQ